MDEVAKLIDRLMAAASERGRVDDTTELLVEAAEALHRMELARIRASDGPRLGLTLAEALASAGGDPEWPGWRPD